MKNLLLICLFLTLSSAGFSYQAKTSNLAVIKVGQANVHISPNINKETLTQVIYGDLVTIKKQTPNWALIEINNQSDNKGSGWRKYRGWIRLSALNKIAPSQRKRYLINRAILINQQEGLYLTINRVQGQSFKHDKIVMQGTILPVLAKNNTMMKLLLPTGEVGFVNKKNVHFLHQKRSSTIIKKIFLKTAKKFLRKKYIWGGITPLGVDCSGLIYFAARSAGIMIPRDVAPQFKALQPILRSEMRAGDLIYFSTYKKGASHVGIYLGRMRFLNAISKNVKISNLSDKYFSQKIVGYRSLTARKSNFKRSTRIKKYTTTQKPIAGLYGQYFMSLSQEKNVLQIVDILNRKFKTPLYVIPFWNKSKIFYRIFGGFYNSKKDIPRLTYKRKRTVTKLIKAGLYKNKMFAIQIAALRDPFIMIKKLKELSKKHDNIWLKYEKNKQGILWSSLLFNHFRSFKEAELAYKSKSYRLKPKPYIRKFKVK